MSNLNNNGLKKTIRGQEEQVSSNLDLALIGKAVKEITIRDCIVINVLGMETFENFKYLPVDKGSILVDVLLPEGRSLFTKGRMTRLATNIRVRDSEDVLASTVGMLKEDFLFDEYGKPRIGDLIIRNYDADNVSFDGEFIFKKPTKRYGSVNGYNTTRASIYGEKISPSFNALYGGLDPNAASKYKEIYLNELRKGDYYG
jgi:hypothetical protein